MASRRMAIAWALSVRIFSDQGVSWPWASVSVMWLMPRVAVKTMASAWSWVRVIERSGMGGSFDAGEEVVEVEHFSLHLTAGAGGAGDAGFSEAHIGGEDADVVVGVSEGHEVGGVRHRTWP